MKSLENLRSYEEGPNPIEITDELLGILLFRCSELETFDQSYWVEDILCAFLQGGKSGLELENRRFLCKASEFLHYAKCSVNSNFKSVARGLATVNTRPKREVLEPDLSNQCL
jgi:hypothetical protein